MIKFAFFDGGYQIQIKQNKRQFPICHIARTLQKLKLKAHQFGDLSSMAFFIY